MSSSSFRRLATVGTAGALLAAGPAFAQSTPTPAPSTTPPTSGAGAPLPPFELHYKTVTGEFGQTRRATAEGDVLFTWGDIRLTADKLEYDADAARITATGKVVLVRGDETIRTNSLTIDLTAGTFGADQAVIVSPPFFVRGAHVERSAGVLTATDAFLTTCPSGKGEFNITARQVIVDQNDDDLFLKDASLRLFGLRLLSIRSLRVPLPSGNDNHRDIGPLPINVHSSRISGFVLGFTPTFQIAPRTEVQTRLDLTSRRSIQYGATVSRDLIGVSGPRLPTRASAPTAVFAAETGGVGSNSGGADATTPAESPLRRLLRARPLPKPDAVLDYESVLTRNGVGPDVLLRPAQIARPGLTGQFTFTSNQEIGGKRQGLLLLSRQPEVTLIGQLPLGYGNLPTTSDDAAFRSWIRTLRPVFNANISYGEYRERRLQQDQATVRDDRTSVTASIGTLPLLVGDHLLVRPTLRMTQNWYGSGDQYRFAEVALSAQYTLAQRSALGAAYVNRGIDGNTPFTFDQIDTRTEVQFWGQTQMGRITLGGLGRYDLAQGNFFDYELTVGVRGCSLEPRFSFRRLNRQLGVTFALPGLTTF